MSAHKMILFYLLNVLFIGFVLAYDYSTVDLVYSPHANNQQDIWQSNQELGSAVASPVSCNFTTNNSPARDKVIDIAIIQGMHPVYLEALCNAVSDQELFTNYYLYDCQNYLTYIRRRPGYENFIKHDQKTPALLSPGMNGHQLWREVKP